MPRPLAIGIVCVALAVLIWVLAAYVHQGMDWIDYFRPAALELLAGVLMFRWYLSPPLPAYFLGILLGASELLRLIRLKVPASTAGWSPAFFSAALPVLLLAAVPITSIARSWTIHPDHGPDRPAPEMAWIQVELLYREAAEGIKPFLKPGDVVAAGDVGVVGFISSAEILDLVGLNSPQSLKYFPLDPRYYVINYAVPPRLIADLKPDYVIILEVYGREGLLKDEEFIQSYRLLHHYPTDIYGSRGLLVFQRGE